MYSVSHGIVSKTIVPSCVPWLAGERVTAARRGGLHKEAKRGYSCLQPAHSRENRKFASRFAWLVCCQNLPADVSHIHCVSKKLPTLKLFVTLSNLSWFSKFVVYRWKAYEICYKTRTTNPPHFRHVATLPWEIKNSNFLQMWKKIQTNCIFNCL